VQNRVLHWLVDDLGYTYLGNLEDIDNKSVKEELLKDNLKKRGYSDDQIKTAIAELVSKTNNQVDTLYQINRSVYPLLRYGRQGVKHINGHRQTVHYIDWKDGNNDFYVAEEVSVLRFDQATRKRPDVVLYINGIALGIFELKSSFVSARKGIRQLLQNQKRENILNFFSTAQLLFAGNEAERLFYGTINTPEKYYLKWKEDAKATDKLSTEIKQLQAKEVNCFKRWCGFTLPERTFSFSHTRLFDL
jgi:type I restriction enzyme R subunit